jgi:hypothetical protein
LPGLAQDFFTLPPVARDDEELDPADLCQAVEVRPYIRSITEVGVAGQEYATPAGELADEHLPHPSAVLIVEIE